VAADIGVTTYAVDEQTAIKVVDASVEVVSEGAMDAIQPSPVASESGSAPLSATRSTER
jgi:hypothetical protein